MQNEKNIKEKTVTSREDDQRKTTKYTRENGHMCDLTKPHKKKSNGVKSHDLGGQFTSPPREMTMPSNRSCRISNVTRSAVLLKPHVVGVQIMQFRPKEVGNHRPIEVTVDSDDLANVVLTEIWTDDAASSKSTPSSDFFEMHWTLLDLTWIGIVSNSTILFVRVLLQSEMGLIAEDDFSMKIGVSCQLLQSPFNEHKPLSMDVYLQFLGQLNFVRIQAQVTAQNSPSCGLRKAEFL